MKFEKPLYGGNILQRVKISEKNYREIRRSFNRQPTDTKDDAEARNDFGSMEGDFIYHAAENQFERFR